MSMPQPITIAIICTDKNRIIHLKNNITFLQKGINPKYYLLSPNDEIDKIINPQNNPNGFIELWISLDKESFQHCQNHQKTQESKSGYSRGFYKELLPEVILSIDENLSLDNIVKELKSIMKKVMNAFCESS